MKKRLTVLLCALLLTGCAPSKSPTSSETSSETLLSEVSSEVSSESVSSEESFSPSSVSESGVSYAWSVDTSLRGLAFLTDLDKEIEKSQTRSPCTYDDLKQVLAKSDLNADGTGLVPFYHSMDDAVSNYYWSGSSGQGAFNREHVWPNSRGVGKSGPGSDPQMIRPALVSENSDRGNHVYGLDQGTYDPAASGFESARGEAARIIFYTACRYYDTHKLYLSNDTSNSDKKHMGQLKYLIRWNREYPVTEMEKLRNDRLDEMGFARNPFIDHPEYADYIWTEKGYCA